MNNKVIPYVLFDCEESILNRENCVYKITTIDGHFKIGFTTEDLRRRVREYCAISCTEELHQCIVQNPHIKVEVLHENHTQEILELLEQFEINNAVNSILDENGLAVRDFNSNTVFARNCIKNSLLLNRKFDKLNVVNKYFAGCYEDYFKYHEIPSYA